MNKTKLSMIANIVFIIIAVIFGKMNLDKNSLISALNASVESSGESPSSIVQQDGEVQIIYKDRIATKEIPPEGGIRFNTVEYQKAISALDSLLKIQAGAMRDGYVDSTLIRDGNEPAPYFIAPPDAETPAITASIDSLKAIVYDPIGSGLLTIKTWGLCARPQLGGGWNGQLAPYLGAKIFFFNRAGIVLGTTSHQAGIGLSYRLDRWIKPLRNTEGMILYGVPFRKDSGGLYAGIAVNL